MRFDESCLMAAWRKRRARLRMRRPVEGSGCAKPARTEARRV